MMHKKLAGFEEVAYREGWDRAGRNVPRHERPNYVNPRDREAADKGWNDHAEKMRASHKDIQPK